MKRCVCEKPRRREERSEGGALLATFCSACTRPLFVNCPSCGHETEDLQAHFKLATACWEKGDIAGYREWQRKLADR